LKCRGYINQSLDIFIRGDAAFAKPEFYEYVEARNINYVCRLIANPNLEDAIDDLFTRPSGKLSYGPKYSIEVFIIRLRVGLKRAG